MDQRLIDKGEIGMRVLSASAQNLSSTLSADALDELDELDELWNRKNNRFDSTLGLRTAVDPTIRCGVTTVLC